MLIFKNIFFFVHGAGLVLMLVLAVFLVLHKSPVEQAALYKARLGKAIHETSVYKAADLPQPAQMLEIMLEDALRAVQIAPYDREAWITLSALLMLSEDYGAISIQADQGRPSHKALVVAQALNPRRGDMALRQRRIVDNILEVSLAPALGQAGKGP